MRGLLKLFISGINPKRIKNTETPKRLLFTQTSQEKQFPKHTPRAFPLTVNTYNP